MVQAITAKEAAEKWSVSKRRVQTLCSQGRIFGAEKHGNFWMIPSDAPKPSDARATRYKDDINTLPQQPVLTSIDLFSGPGGLATGFRWAGIKPLIAVEWSYWTVQTYASSHDAEILDLEQYLNDPESIEQFFGKSDRPIIIFGDINKVDIDLFKLLLRKRYGLETVDVVTGGAPCESFSMAGDRKEVDERNQLYQNVLRIAQGINSKMFLFENVKGLFSKKYNGKSGAMYRVICDEFENVHGNGVPTFRLASRDKNTVLLKAVDYGVPQLRERLFLVGLNNEYPELDFSYPKKTNGVDCPYGHLSVSDALSDLPPLEAGQECVHYQFNIEGIEVGTPRSQFLRRMRGDLSMPPSGLSFRKDTLTGHKAPSHTEKMQGRIKLIRQGESMRTAYDRLVNEGRASEVEKYFPRKIYGARNRRLKPDEPSFTVTSHCLDEMIHPFSDRGLTPREVARLQSFPDWYVFQGPYMKFHSDPEQDQYEQIGDAIPPLVAYALGKEIVRCLIDFQN